MRERREAEPGRSVCPGEPQDSLERQGDAWFVGLDRRIANRILQVAARHAFGARTPISIRISTPENLPSWDEYEITARTPTP